jgi:putative ATP-binding cassette transporter
MSLETHLAPDEKRLISRFWQSATEFWRGRPAWRAWPLVALLIAIVLLQLLVQYRLNFWNRDFFNAIERKDGAELWAQALRFVPLAVANVTLAITSVWGRMTMQRKWRAWLSNHLYDYWLENGHYRRLRFMLGDHQTPEYRIAEDARIATDVPIDLAVGLLSSLLTAITFIAVLWSVGGSLAVTAFGLILAIPGYLVFAVLLYSMLVTAAMMLIASRLTRVMQENKRAEAELRATGAHIRESGEGTALPDGKKDTRRTIGAALGPSNCSVAGIMLAAHAVDTGYPIEPVTGTDCRVAPLHAEISRRDIDSRSSRPGSRSVRHSTGRVQLDHRQLWAPCGVDLFGKPRGLTPSSSGSDRSSRTTHEPLYES